jgi:hypothetical protein
VCVCVDRTLSLIVPIISGICSFQSVVLKLMSVLANKVFYVQIAHRHVCVYLEPMLLVYS